MLTAVAVDGRSLGAASGVGVTPAAGVGSRSICAPSTPKNSAIAEREDGTASAIASTSATIAAAATGNAGRRVGRAAAGAAIDAMTRPRRAGVAGYVVVAAE